MDSQEEILYFSKERIALENSKQISEVVITDAHIVIVSFSGSIYLYPNTCEDKQIAEENNKQNEVNHHQTSTTQATQSTEPLQSTAIAAAATRGVISSPLFVAFDHTLELPFTHSTLLSEKRGNSIELLLLARNSQAAILEVNHQKLPHKVFIKHVNVLLPKEVSDQFVKSTRFIKPNILLVVYLHGICLLDLSCTKEEGKIGCDCIFTSEDEVDQVDYFSDVLCISTFKKYFSFNLSTRSLLQLGSKDKQGFFGIAFFPRNQNEMAMAARPNGYMWRVSTSTGLVQTTLQFKDEENRKISFNRIVSFDRFLVSIIGENKLVIIDMNDKQQMTKEFTGCSQLSLLPPSHADSDFFYVHYIENNCTLAIEKCSIKNIQKSFEESLSAQGVLESAELFEKYDALQNMRNLKRILAANKRLQEPCQFSSAFKDSVKRIEDEAFNWNGCISSSETAPNKCETTPITTKVEIITLDSKIGQETENKIENILEAIPISKQTFESFDLHYSDRGNGMQTRRIEQLISQIVESEVNQSEELSDWNWLVREKTQRGYIHFGLKIIKQLNDESQLNEKEDNFQNEQLQSFDELTYDLMLQLNRLTREQLQRFICLVDQRVLIACQSEISLILQAKAIVDMLNDTDIALQLTLESLAGILAYYFGVSQSETTQMILNGSF